MLRLSKQRGNIVLGALFLLMITSVIAIDSYKHLQHQELQQEATILGNKLAMITNAVETRLSLDKDFKVGSYALNDLINQSCGGNAKDDYLPCGFSLNEKIYDGYIDIEVSQSLTNPKIYNAAITTDPIGKFNSKTKTYFPNAMLAGTALKAAQSEQAFSGNQYMIAAASYSLDRENAEVISDVVVHLDDESSNVGSVVAYVGSTVPDGYFECNGASFDINAYPKLYKVLNSKRLPDLRGEFVRGWDHGRGVDGGRVLGSYQEDMLKNHSHGYTRSIGWVAGPAASNIRYPGGPSMGDLTQQTGFTGGSETRPKNIALMYIIKHD